ncbi:MAG: hypothetical protein PHR51_02485 [Patescibacteria group bacterium]|nr:hypothetical protein [Patescibacteria group bacterium]
MHQIIGSKIKESDIPLLDLMVQDYGFQGFKTLPSQCGFASLRELIDHISGPEMTEREFFLGGGVYTRLLHCKKLAEQNNIAQSDKKP